MKPDIFDLIAPDQEDEIDRVESEDSAVEKIKKDFSALLERFDARERRTQNTRLTEEVKDFLREEIAKIKPIQRVIEKKVETVHVEPRVIQAPAAPPQIIKEVRVEVQTEKKDTRDLVEMSALTALQEKISELEEQLRKVKWMAESPLVIPGGPGGPGVIGIPPPEGNDGKVLTVVNRKAVWATATGGGGSSADAYTPSNVTSDRSFDADDTSLDELADVLGSLIVSLQGAGIIQ